MDGEFPVATGGLCPFDPTSRAMGLTVPVGGPLSDHTHDGGGVYTAEREKQCSFHIVVQLFFLLVTYFRLLEQSGNSKNNLTAGI